MLVHVSNCTRPLPTLCVTSNNPSNGANPGCPSVSKSSNSALRGPIPIIVDFCVISLERQTYGRLEPTVPTETYLVPKWGDFDLKSPPVKEDPHSNQRPSKLDGKIRIANICFCSYLPTDSGGIQ